ncbi:MAG: P1 family peptidase [Actinomycetota bacterium]|nr:P1 family peptidase [Actinomycetota bacterium]
MITAISGIRVGHVTDLEGATGCTVVLPPAGTTGSGEVRGGAPGTRETDLLRPGMLVDAVNAILLTGGSAFGLGAAAGVMRFLEEQGIGFDTGVARVPIVPAAALFDLWVGDATARPGPDDGYAACTAASEGSVQEGSVGAGTGATVAKEQGPARAVKGGIGTASAEREGLIVSALMANNAVGEILDEEGNVLAGAIPDPDAPEGPPGAPGQGLLPGTNTVIGVVATNARLSKERAHLLAIAAHEGTSAAVRPAHTIWDGDTVFSLATGEIDAPQPIVEELAVQVVSEAIRRSVRFATSVAGIPVAQPGESR